MRRFLIIILLPVFFATGLHAQSVKRYNTISNELIFSYSEVGNGLTGGQFKSVLRFSGFLNIQRQYHFDFAKSFGLYTGLGIRNVGLITHPTDTLNDKIKIKQRAYGIGVPLAFKFGNMEKRQYIAVGIEAEYFFNYKEKVFVNGSKKKYNDWFPKKLNQFNPSVFVELQVRKGLFIRAKYYLLDFLTHESSTAGIPGYSDSSKLFYISIGKNLIGSDKKKHPAPASTPNKISA